MHEPAALSYILVTDTFDRIRPVIERLQRQTVADRLELVLIAPRLESMAADVAALVEFRAVQTLEVPRIVSLAEARAAGVRAARAPIVFVGETHSYPHPGLAAALIDAHETTGCAVIVPAFGNANPDGSLSWAGFLSDYAPWSEGLEAGGTDFFPLYNAAYRRSALLEFGERLAPALDHGDELLIGLEQRGHLAWFEPRARIDHVNVSRPWPWVHERFLSGLMIAGSRSARWSRPRRAAYALASPLIPVVLLRRLVKGARETGRRRRLPRGTLPAIVLGAGVKAAGELVGYAFGAGEAAGAGMMDYELRKLAFTARDVA